jgi:thiol-disulfide isomerase/thioredoxin
VVLVDVFGSWCPNCNDLADLHARWYREYHERGLEIVGLAYEMTGEPERDREYVKKYAKRHGIEYPLLLAGTEDKAQASKTLPDLSEVVAFPTTIFIGRDGKVKKVYSGFAGPATGRHHRRLVRDHEKLIEELLGPEEG